MSLQNNIRDLIFFYVKTNYNQYLEENQIKYIPESDINKVINTLYCLSLSRFSCTNIRLHSKKNYYVFSQNASNKQNVD